MAEEQATRGIMLAVSIASEDADVRPPIHPGPLCAEIFDLAANHGLPCDDDDPHLRDRVEAFIEDYRAWVPERDAAVQRYLQETRSRYRLFLPDRPSAPITAGQMYWYFDDLVMQDEFNRFVLSAPFVRHFDAGPLQATATTTSIRPWAEHVNRQLVLSSLLAGPMRDGVVLSTSPPGFDANKILPAAEDVEIRRVLSKDYRCGIRLEIQPDQSSAWVYRRVDDAYGRFAVAHHRTKPLPPLSTVQGSLPFEEHYYHFQPRGVVPSGFEDVVARCARNEVIEFAQLLASAQIARGAILSERDVDTLLMGKLVEASSSANDAALRNSRSFELALPHVQGLSPLQLFKLRAELPDAFEAFRAQLTSYCIDSRNVEHAQSRAEELTKIEKELEASLRAKLRSNRILGYGSGAVAAASIVLGALGITFLGPTLPILGAGGMFASAARSEMAKRELMASPACFIWKAKRTVTETERSRSGHAP